MGSFFSKSIKHSADISGNHNTVWFINGAKFDISIFNQTIQNAVEKLEKIIIANNANITINIMVILIIITLPIIFLYLRYYYQQFSPKINVNNPLLSKCNRSSTSYDKSLSKNISIYAGGYLV
jgi:hypothetical protein